MARLLSGFLATTLIALGLLLFCLLEFSFVKDKVESDRWSSRRCHEVKDSLESRHQDESFAQWSETDRLLYQAIDHALRDLGESGID